jgi:hypothetical protein
MESPGFWPGLFVSLFIIEEWMELIGRCYGLCFHVVSMFLELDSKLGRILVNGYANRPANDSNLEGGDRIMAHRRYDLIEFA